MSSDAEAKLHQARAHALMNQSWLEAADGGALANAVSEHHVTERWSQEENVEAHTRTSSIYNGRQNTICGKWRQIHL